MENKFMKSFFLLIYCIFFFNVIGFLVRGGIALLSYYNHGYFDFSLSEAIKIMLFSLVASISVCLYSLLSKFIDWYSENKKRPGNK